MSQATYFKLNYCLPRKFTDTFAVCFVAPPFFDNFRLLAKIRLFVLSGGVTGNRRKNVRPRVPEALVIPDGRSERARKRDGVRNGHRASWNARQKTLVRSFQREHGGGRSQSDLKSAEFPNKNRRRSLKARGLNSRCVEIRVFNAGERRIKKRIKKDGFPPSLSLSLYPSFSLATQLPP